MFGKQIGVTLFSWLAVRSGLAELPEGVGWRHVYGVGWLAGIGFTMSLFISDLAFSDGALVDTAKLGILAASLISGVVGWTLLRRATPSADQDDVHVAGAVHADEERHLDVPGPARPRVETHVGRETVCGAGVLLDGLGDRP